MTTTTAKPLAQRKPLPHTPKNNYTTNTNILLERLTYGVPPQRRIITPGVLRKRGNLIVDCLRSLGYPAWRRSVILELVRLYAYYGKVYPKARHIAEDAYCSKRTFWRAIQQLEQDGFIERNNRFLHHLQISNAYRLDKLILVITRYISEHAEHLFAKDAPDFVFQPGHIFWTLIWQVTVRLRDPVPITTMA